MRIAVIAHALRGDAGGYVVGINFVRALAKVAPQHQFLIASPVGIGYEDLKLTKGSKIYPYTLKRTNKDRVIFDEFILPRVLKDYRPDVIFGMCNRGLRNPPARQAFLLHGPQFVYGVKHYKKEILSRKLVLQYHKYCLKSSLRWTDLVFCQTPIMRERFARVFNYPIEQIKIMPNAVSEYAKLPKGAVLKPDIFNKGAYLNLFFLSRFYAHKNPEILIDVFRKHREPLKDVRCIITIIEDHHPRVPRFFQNIRKYRLEENIVNVGPLRQEELAGYFYYSDALFFPTLLESFSGTYIEAMYFGVPILATDFDFARYICNDAALYYDADSSVDFIEKINLLRSSVSLQKDLTEKGSKRYKEFSYDWASMVKKSIKSMQEIIK